MRFGGGLPVHCCLSPHQYARDMGLSREFVCVRGEGTNGFFPPEECENQMTAEPSASPSGVCPSLPAGSNYVGSRLCYRRADDDAVSLCDAPQQASALPRRLGFGRFPQSRDKQRAVMLAKEPRSKVGDGTGRASNKFMGKSTEKWMAPSAHGVWNWAPWPGPGTVRVPTSAKSGTHAIIPRSLALCLCTCQAITRKSSHFSCPSLAGCLGSASSSSSFCHDHCLAAQSHIFH